MGELFEGILPWEIHKNDIHLSTYSENHLWCERYVCSDIIEVVLKLILQRMEILYNFMWLSLFCKLK